MVLAVRTHGEPTNLLAAMRSEIAALDKDLPLSDVKSLEQVTRSAVARTRFTMLLLSVFAGVALLLASVGIYGMVGFAVSQRTHEVGVRMALGACGGDVLGLVLRETMRPGVIGLGTGIAGAAMVSHILSSMLFGLSALDPVTYLGVSTFLAVVALLAGYVPARRATKVDPMVALRHE